MHKSLEAYVSDVIFDRAERAIFALGDGRVVFEDGPEFEAHPMGSILCAASHPSGEGIITGGDDGRLVWTTGQGSTLLFEQKRAWIDVLAVSAETSLIAFGVGKTLHVLDAKDPKFSRTFVHEHSVAGVDFDPKGRRIAVATYNGAALWYARIEGQTPQILKWAGSHIGIKWSPDGKFIISAMQENALHGWRLSDSQNLRMGGYPAKIKSLDFFAKGKLMASSGAQGAVVWPFLKANGPMGEQGSEINPQDQSLVTVVSGAANTSLLAAGLEDGRVWVAELAQPHVDWLKAERGSPITALKVAKSGNRIACGDEDGAVYVFDC